MVFIINLISIFFKINEFEPKTHYPEIVLGIGDGSSLNESDLQMTLLPPVLSPISRYHNSSPLNYIDTGDCVYDLASGSRISTAQTLPAESKVPKSVRVALTYK